MAAAPSVPSPPTSPPAPAIPHLILGSLRYTVAWDLVSSVFLLAVWFFAGRCESYWLSYSSRRSTGQAGDSFTSTTRLRNKRLTQLLSVWRAGLGEVTTRCGQDASDYLVVTRLCLLALAAAALPGVCVLLPVSVILGNKEGTWSTHGRASTNGDALWFARTTIHHFPNESPLLWFSVATSFVTVTAIECVADYLSKTLVNTRFKSLEMRQKNIAGVTLLLRRVPRAVCRNPESLRRALDARFPGRVFSVVVPLDGGEARARRLVSAARVVVANARNEAARSTARASRSTAVGGGYQRISSSLFGSSPGGLERRTRELLPSDDSDAFYDQKVAAALQNSRLAESDLRNLLASRAEPGAWTPSPGLVFVVFRDPGTAERALRALRTTVSGTCLAYVSQVLPFSCIKRLAPGFKAGVDVDGDGVGGDTTARVRNNAREEGMEDELTEGLLATSARLDDADEDDETETYDDESQNAPRSIGRRPFFTPGTSPRTNEKMPKAVALAIGHGVHYWRCTHAPPPNGVLWDNVGVTSGKRFLLSCCTNVSVFLGLVFFSSPLAVFSYAGEVAASLDPEIDWRWQAWLQWATNKAGPTAGLLFQFVPNLVTLITIYALIPFVLEQTTTFEKHLTRSGALRSLVSKEFYYFLINILILLALGKAALSAVVEQIRACQWHATPDACELKFIKILGESFVAEAAMSLCGFLVSCCTIGPAWELLSLFSWIAECVWDRKNPSEVSSRSEGTQREWNGDGLERGSGDDDEQQVQVEGTPIVITPSSARRTDTRSWVNATPVRGEARIGYFLTPSPKPRLASRAWSARKPVFDLPGQHAFNATVLACTVVFASLAPVLLPCGVLFFGIRYFVHKHNLLCLHLDAVAGVGGGNSGLFGSHGGLGSAGDIAGTSASLNSSRAASDGRLLATVVRIIRVSTLLHTSVMAAFTYMRGTRGQIWCQGLLFLGLVFRDRVARVYLRVYAKKSGIFHDGEEHDEALMGESLESSRDTDPSILSQHVSYRGPFQDETYHENGGDTDLRSFG